MNQSYLEDYSHLILECGYEEERGWMEKHMDKRPFIHTPASCTLILSIPLCASLATSHGWIQNWLLSLFNGAGLRERKLIEVKSSRVQTCHMRISWEKQKTFRKLSITAFDTRKHRQHERKKCIIIIWILEFSRCLEGMVLWSTKDETASKRWL